MHSAVPPEFKAIVIGPLPVSNVTDSDKFSSISIESPILKLPLAGLALTESM